MTTYVLHGGKTSLDTPQTDAFFRQFSELMPKQQGKYLMCYWARPVSQWQELFNRDTQKIIGQTKKRLSVEMIDSPRDLFQKLPGANGLYVAGGDAEPLEKQYPQLIDLKRYLKGKVYLGSSMGAFMAAKNYVLSLDSQDEDTVHPGLGLLPINTLCHWNVEKKKEMKLKLLCDFDPQTPILTLNEGEFVVIYR
jgi:peptidase E